MYKEEVAEKIMQMYQSGEYSIQEICDATGIRSSRTIYSIAKRKGLPIGKAYNKNAMRIVLDEEVKSIIHDVNPPNISQWICQVIKQSYKQHSNTD